MEGVGPEGGPEQVRELGHHPPGLDRLVLQERRDRVQGVEEEVGVELHLQGPEPGVAELGLRPHRLHLALPGEDVVGERVIDPDHGPVDHEADDEVLAEVVPEPPDDGGAADRIGVERLIPERLEADGEDRDGERRRRVHRHAPADRGPVEGEAPCEHHDRHRDQRPEEPDRELENEERRQRRGVAHGRPGHVDLPHREERDRGPDGHDDRPAADARVPERMGSGGKGAHLCGRCVPEAGAADDRPGPSAAPDVHPGSVIPYAYWTCTLPSVTVSGASSRSCSLQNC